MEAPEKIYRRLECNYIKYYDYKPAKIRYNEKDPIEYIRTDAFIEKALKFLDENFFFDNGRYHIASYAFDSKKEMFEDFKKYMEL